MLEASVTYLHGKSRVELNLVLVSITRAVIESINFKFAGPYCLNLIHNLVIFLCWDIV